MWSTLEKGFQMAFEVAWDAYKANTIPIGAAILNEKGDVVALGQNQVRSTGNGVLSYHQLAHAEANAIFQISEETEPNLHPHIRKYTLYTVMEPCPFCFGAIVMGSIKDVKFAARDNYGGATALNHSLPYIINKKITITGPFPDLEVVQIAMQTCYELERSGNQAMTLLNSWRETCPSGVAIGKELYEQNILNQFKINNKHFCNVFDYMAKYN